MPPVIVNPQATQFRDQFYEIPVPPWLRTGNAEKYLYVLNLMSDFLCQKAFEAMTIRLPGAGDESNIPYLAFDRNLVQGPKESNANFTVRLTESFETWDESGSALAVLGQLQAYLQNLQPGVDPTLPMLTIVGNDATGGAHYTNTWNQIYQGDPIGQPPTLSTVSPDNFSWDGFDQLNTWRRWLILPMAQVATGLSGSSAQTGSVANSACFTSPGRNVDGVWVPAITGTPVNTPWMTIIDLAGLTSNQVGQWITMTGSTNPQNNGCFQIVQVLSSTSCVIANPGGIRFDTGPLTWSIGYYPFIGPGPAWGAPNWTFGQGQLTIPPVYATTPLPENTGPFGVTNGSATVNIPSVAFLTAGDQIQFGSQAGVTYTIKLIDAATNTITLTTPYSGTTDPLTTVVIVQTWVGANVGGVWQPTPPVQSPSGTMISWGLNCFPQVIVSIRNLVKTWKSSGTYYQYIIVAFDCGNGAPGNAYSPNSTEGAGNPDGTFGSFGKNVDGVWVPTRIISGNPLTPYLWDCYCQGTGTYNNCSVENVT
jgi:hypothetical protein